MPDVTIDIAAFADTRRGIESAEDEIRAIALKIGSARAERDRLAATGVPAGVLVEADIRVTDLLAEHAEAISARDALLHALRDLAHTTARDRDPAEFVTTLDGRRPIALLPVRLETRFFASGTELRIRIYPDQLHLDSHEPHLTDAEVAAGQRYWQARWQASATVRRTAWEEIAKTLEPRRARWVIEQLTPANLSEEATANVPIFGDPDRKAGPWTRAVHTTALPSRWVAIGYRGGTELFRRWGEEVPDTLATTPTPDPAADPDEEVPVSSEDPPGDEAMRWTIDYDDALAAGMAITVTDTQLPGGQSLADGLDRLVVLGVDWTRTADASANRLAALLDAHRASDGLSFLAQGTPTNNTGTARSGMSTARSALIDDLDPGSVPAVPPGDCAGRRAAHALGLPEQALDPVSRSGLLEARTAARLHEVLWAATLGHYLGELFAPLADDDTVGFAREHVTRWLRPGGPYAPLRVGRQPYGVLPVISANHFVPERPGGFDDRLASLLAKLRPVWTGALARVPRMGHSGDVDTDLLELLQRNPAAMIARWRKVFGPASVADTSGFTGHANAQGWLWSVWRRYLGWPTAPELALYAADPKDHPLPVPWVQQTPVGDGPLEPNYLVDVAGLARTAGGREQLVAMADADTLLQTLVAHAAAEELDRAAESVVLTHLDAGPELVAAAKALRTREMYGVVAAADAPQGVTVSTPRQMAHLVIPEVTGDLTVAEFVAEIIASVPEHPDVHTLGMFLDGLDELATRPAAEIDRALRGLLDSTSHRFDAWATSLATRRLDAARQDRPSGVHLGGYGWVENLRVGNTPDSLGYVHAPSLPHAATAAILRSGRLSHRDNEQDPFGIQLTSDRVQRALPVLEGAAAGQQLAALLGYRFERALRESADRLARYILPARRFAPLHPSAAAEGAGRQEAIAAPDVVDGVRLAERWRDDRSAVLARLDVASADRPAVTSVLDEVATTYDAVGDVLVAEAVYQTTLGNYERAGAAIAAIDKQQRPPDPEVIRTPRTGISYVQKVFVAAGRGPAREPWRTLSDVRSRMAPQLNAWAAGLLPDPEGLRFWGVLTSSPDSAQPVTSEVSATATEVGLSPLALVLATASGAANQPSELEARIAQALAAGVTLGEEHRLELVDGRPGGARSDEVNLGALRALLMWMRELLTGCRPLIAEDLTLPGGDRATGIDLASLAAHADAAAAALGEAESEIATVAADEGASEAALRNALRGVADLGFAEAVPCAATGDPAALRAQIGPTGDELARRRSRLDEVGAAPGETPTEAAIVTHHTARVHAVLGEGFPVVPAVHLTGTADVTGLAASLADADALNAGDATAARAWVDRMAVVRPGVDRLARVLQAAEVLGAAGGGRGSVAVAQLPHQPGQRWLALPFADGGPAAARVAVTLHTGAGFDPADPVAGLVCDEWLETIPRENETTGVTFHYDAPAARAPQAVLLAVPPRPAMASWDLNLALDTVLEAVELARIRGVGPKELWWTGATLPMVYLPENFTGDRPPIDFGRLLARFAGDIPHADVVGKGWSL